METQCGDTTKTNHGIEECKMTSQSLFLGKTFLLIVFLSSFVMAQPCSYFVGRDSAGQSGEIMRFDHRTGTVHLFLSIVARDLEVSADQSAEWVFIEGRDLFLIVKAQDTTVRYEPLAQKGFEQVNGVFHPRNTNLFYLSWIKEQGDVGVEQKGVFDGSTLMPINTAPFYVVLGPECTLLPDGSAFCALAFDSLKNMFLVTFSISQNTVVGSRSFDDIGPTTQLKSYQDGRNGRILIRYGLQPGNENKRYFVYDPNTSGSSPDIPHSKRSIGFLSAGADKVILQEILFEKSQSERREYATGNVDVFEASTGLLLGHLNLPPEGQIRVFDGYANDIYYYIPGGQRSITIDLDSLNLGISSYSLFATHGLWLEQNADVISGDIGINEAGTAPFLDSQVELSVGIGTTTASGYSIKANRIKIKQGSTVGSDVYYNELDNNGTITGTQHAPLTLPLVSTLPEFKQATPGPQNITIPQSGTQTLQPGSYGDILVRKNGKLIFTGGVYHLASFNTGDNAQLLFQAPSEVRIAGKFDTDQGSYIGPEDTTSVSANQIVFYIGGINGSNGNLGATPKAAQIGLSNVVKANFYVPNGTLWIRQNSQATGAFVGKDVDVGIGVKVWLKSAF